MPVRGRESATETHDSQSRRVSAAAASAGEFVIFVLRSPRRANVLTSVGWFSGTLAGGCSAALRRATFFGLAQHFNRTRK
jgi:hypothetical protein